VIGAGIETVDTASTAASVPPSAANAGKAKDEKTMQKTSSTDRKVLKFLMIFFLSEMNLCVFCHLTNKDNILAGQKWAIYTIIIILHTIINKT
jgi:hypothetical protein